MEFVNLTREVGIGANSYLLHFGGKNLILDSGLHPKREGWDAAPNFSLLSGIIPDAAVITHAHQDHVGSLPILTKNYPQMPVHLSVPTARVGDIMLHNSVNVMTRQREDGKVMDYPLFTHKGVELSRHAWHLQPLRQAFGYNGERASAQATDLPTLEFFDAGHILGSVGVMVRFEGRSLFYTGDVHFKNQTLMQAADFPTEGVDVLVMETTRGDTPSTPGYTREAEKQRLAQIILDAFAEDAAVTIPVFALGKTQELLAMLWELKLEGRLPSSPIYIGGLSTKVTEAYDTFADSTGRGHPELQLLQDISPYVVSGREIEALAPRKRCIFALSSGMMTEKTLSSVFVRKIIEDPKQRLVFVGYSDPESPAGILRRAAKGEKVFLDSALPALQKNCQVEELNFSAHAPREDLLEYALRLKPATVVLVHGDRPAIEWFRSEIARALPATRVVIPEPGVRVRL